MEIVSQILLILFIILLNAFFVASEFALVAVRKTRIDELVKSGRRGARRVKEALEDVDRYLSAVQLGVTAASLGLGWLGEPLLAATFEHMLFFLPEGPLTVVAHVLGVAVSFLLITYLTIVLGELVPKFIALSYPEIVAILTIRPLTAFAAVFEPFIRILRLSAALIVRPFGLSALGDRQTTHSEEEIRLILDQSSERGVIPQDEAAMAQNVFKLGEMPIKQIMVPRTDIVAVNVITTLREVIRKIQKYPHSRFPVFEHTIDTIVGFVHIKDVYKAALKKDEHMKISQIGIIRDIISVPEAKKADDVLVDMRRKRVHLAVVSDEYGGTAGIVTLEDVIESLVGDIEDEFDKPIHDIKKQADGSYFIDGRVPVELIQTQFNLEIRGQGYSTIGGLVFGLLGREPKAGDTVQVGTSVLRIEEMSRKRIKTIRLRREEVPRKRFSIPRVPFPSFRKRLSSTKEAK